MLIGVLGGSFDPPHLAHRSLAELAQRRLGLDLVLWVPAADAWQKRARTAPEVRAHMCELAVAEHPDWLVSYTDLDRGGATYTIDTLADLALAYPGDELVLLLGADAVVGLPTWHRSAELRAARIAVAERVGEDRPWPEGFRLEPLSGSLPDISSTSVRAAVAAGEPIDDLVEPAVADYIREVGLYR